MIKGQYTICKGCQARYYRRKFQGEYCDHYCRPVSYACKHDTENYDGCAGCKKENGSDLPTAFRYIPPPPGTKPYEDERQRKADERKRERDAKERRRKKEMAAHLRRFRESTDAAR